MMNLLLDHKVFLRIMLDLCPNSKEIAFIEWMQRMSKELDKEESICNVTQPKNRIRTKDDNVAKINVSMQDDNVSMQG